MSQTRTAAITSLPRTAEALVETYRRVQRFLPSNYVAVVEGDNIIVTGVDVAGWTLDGYVIPRLASGLLFFTETTTEEITA